MRNEHHNVGKHRYKCVFNSECLVNVSFPLLHTYIVYTFSSILFQKGNTKWSKHYCFPRNCYSHIQSYLYIR